LLLPKMLLCTTCRGTAGNNRHIHNRCSATNGKDVIKHSLLSETQHSMYETFCQGWP